MDQKIILPQPFDEKTFYTIVKFVGRKDELDTLKNLLINPKSDSVGKIAVIYGIPGVGKSALACQFAIKYKNEFPGGIYGFRVDEFINVDNPLQSLAQKFVEISEGIFDNRQDLGKTMDDCFNDRQALLIFDNADLKNNEKINYNQNYICLLNKLFPSQNCSVIVTIQANNVPTESWRIKDSNTIQLKHLLEKESIKLLENHCEGYTERLAEIRNERNKNIVKEILEKVGYLPLAIQIIGTTLTKRSWLHKSLKEYAEELAKHPAKTLQNVCSSVWSTILISIKTLNLKTIRFFACLGACAVNSFSLSLISAVAECEEDEAEQYLIELEDRTLISSLPNKHYKMHNLIFLFAQSILTREEDYDFNVPLPTLRNVKEKHAQYFIKLVNNNQLSSGKISKILYQNFDDLILASEWLAQPENLNDDNYNFIFNGVIIDIINSYGYNRIFLKIVDKFCQTATQQQTLNYYNLVRLKLQRIRFLRDINLSESEISEQEKVKGDVEKLESFTQKQVCRIIYWKNIAGLYERQNKLEQAEEAIDYSIKSLEDLKNNINENTLEELAKLNQNPLHHEAYCFRRKGLILQRKGEYGLKKSEKGKKEYLQDSLEIFKKTFKLYQKSGLEWKDLILGHLGEVLLKLGKVQLKSDKETAEKCLKKAKRILIRSYKYYENQEFKNWKSLSVVLKNLVQTCLILGDKDAAKEYLLKKCDIEKELDIEGRIKKRDAFKDLIKLYINDDEIDNIINLSIHKEIDLSFFILNFRKTFRSNTVKTLKLIEASIKIAEHFENKQEQVFGLNELGLILLEQNECQQAQEKLKQGVEISRGLDNEYSLVISLNNLGKCFLKQENIEEALKLFKESQKISGNFISKKSLVISLNYLADCWRIKGNLSLSEKLLLEAIEIDKKSNDRRSLIQSYTVLLEVYKERKNLNNMVNILRKIIKVNEDLNEQKRLTKSLTYLAKLLGEIGEFKEAIEKIEESIKISLNLEDEDQLRTSINELVNILKKQNNLIETVQILQKYYDLKSDNLKSDNLKSDRLKSLVIYHCKNSLKITIRGKVLNIHNNFGYIISDGLSGERIFFGRQENSDIFSDLRSGILVEFEASYVPYNDPNKKWRTNKIRILK